MTEIQKRYNIKLDLGKNKGMVLDKINVFNAIQTEAKISQLNKNNNKKDLKRLSKVPES